MLDRRANVFSVFTFIFTLLVIVTSVLALADCFDDFTTALFMVMILTCLTMCCHVCDGVVRARHWESDTDEKLEQISRTHEDEKDDEGPGAWHHGFLPRSSSQGGSSSQEPVRAFVNEAVVS